MSDPKSGKDGGRNFRASRDKPEAKPITMPTMNRLGVQDLHDADFQRQYELLMELRGHQFNVAPVTRYTSGAAERKWAQVFGSMNPTFTPERFDRMRERVQTVDKAEQQKIYGSMAMLYHFRLATRFIDDETVDLAAFEKMFDPNYVPTYAEATKVLKLPHRRWWRGAKVQDLENICRLPLENCEGKENKVELTFEEFYSLFWNYYHPFNLVAYYCLSVAQSMVYTRELIDGLAEYIADRHKDLPVDAQKKPIVAVGARIGKLGGLLNATNKIPVPVVSAHEKPMTNPYLLAIPDSMQATFRPHPIQKLKVDQALEKYEPAIVLMSDLPMQQDLTHLVRMQGSVREYLITGVRDSYLEGVGWDTWGNHMQRTEKAKSGHDILAPYVADGFVRTDLNYLSRWAIHKCDDDIACGFGAVTSFARKAFAPSNAKRWSYALRRLSPLM